MTLTAARKARDAAKLQKLTATTADADTFKVTALEWYGLKLESWSSHYAIREKRNLEKDLFPLSEWLTPKYAKRRSRFQVAGSEFAGGLHDDSQK